MKPQLEDGYTRIANEVIEKLYEAPLSGCELRICLLVIRKTWGWKKKEDFISITKIEEGTHITRKNVVQSINKLVTKRLLIKTEGSTNTLKFNKNYQEWVVTKRTLGSYQMVTKVVTKRELELVTKREPPICIKESIKEIKETSTNVLEGFGNPSINRGMQLLRESGGGTKTQLNRFALYRLYKKHGEEKTIQAFQLGVSIRGQPYAPVIKNFLDLEEKWISLEAYVQRKNTEIGGNVYDATGIS